MRRFSPSLLLTAVANFEFASEMNEASASAVKRPTDRDLQFRQLVLGVSDYAIFMLDPEGFISTWNPGAERIKGYRAEEILGRHFSIFYPEESLARDWPRQELAAARRRRAAQRAPAARAPRGATHHRALREQPVAPCRDRSPDRARRGAARARPRAGQTGRRARGGGSAQERVPRHAGPRAAQPDGTGRQRPRDPQLVEPGCRRRVHARAHAAPDAGAGAAGGRSARRLAHRARSHRAAKATRRPRGDGEVGARDRRRGDRRVRTPDRRLASGASGDFSADPVRLAQVLSNLLVNAAKYSEQPGTIELRGAAVDGVVEIAVRDHGIGIAREFLPQIFDLFTQADSSLDRARGGLGIGLTLARRLVELHGGTLTASSEGLGRGSELVIRLPLEAGQQVAAPRESSLKTTPITGATRRVVVVDDSVDAAESTAGMKIESAPRPPASTTTSSSRSTSSD